MNDKTAAELIAQILVLNNVVAELVDLLTDAERELLRDGLRDQARNIVPIDKYEPDCSDSQRRRYKEWDDLAAPRP
jgi:hypothetical protein